MKYIKNLKLFDKSSLNEEYNHNIHSVSIPIETLEKWIDGLDDIEMEVNRTIYVKSWIKEFLSKNLIGESKTDFDPIQLKAGIKVESEHGDVYEDLTRYLKSFDVPMPWSKMEFYKKIAKAHLREMPDYYTHLLRMESDNKKLKS